MRFFYDGALTHGRRLGQGLEVTDLRLTPNCGDDHVV